MLVAAGVNDQEEHARELAALLRKHGVAHHVNLIPFNPITDSDFRRPSKAYVSACIHHVPRRLLVYVSVNKGIQRCIAAECLFQAGL